MEEEIKIPQFKSQKKLFKFLKANKSTLIRQKRAILKKGDGYLYAVPGNTTKAGVNKSEPLDIDGIDEIKVVAIINTTNWMDSHKDVHLPGIWDKSVNENKNGMHVQEHKAYEFNKIIADGADLKVEVKTFTWKELGYDVKGKTEALVFYSTVKRSRNEFMFKQYANGYVKNHSVGMRYVRIKLCINHEDYPEENENWAKYYPEIVNKDAADDSGYFWAVIEAKYVEGSAVPMGSNIITPTQSVGKNTPKPPKSTSDNKSDAGQPPHETGESQNKGFFNNVI